MDWLLLYGNMPIEIRDFVKQNVGDLSDFINTPMGAEGIFSYDSPSTSISITFAFEEDGQLLMIWFPGVEDPTIENHVIFVENNFKKGLTA